MDRPPRYLVRAMKLGGRVEGVSEGVDALERRLEQRLHQLTVRCLTPCDAALGKLVRPRPRSLRAPFPRHPVDG